MPSHKNIEQEEILQDENSTAANEHESLPSADPQELVEEAQGGVSRQEYDRMSQERDALLERLARLQAEFENYRKRSVREQSEFRDYAATEAIKNFLPVLDSFDLALRHQPAGCTEDKGLRSGLELIRKQMEDVLSRLGVQLVPSVGQQFDPRWHEAVEMVESSEHPDHQIIDELQRGYKLKDRLLRPAMVRVATNSAKK